MRLAIFASGGGSNFQAIAEAIAAGTLSAQVVLCLSNSAKAGVLERAARQDIPTVVLNPSDFSDEQTYVAALLDLLDQHQVNFIALAGYLRKIPVEVVRAFQGRMVNIHPALLPAFGGKGLYGRHVHQAVIDYGVRWTGATVHLVEEAYDTGPIVLQEPVPVLQDDTPESLAARVLEVEHRLYPEALRLFANRQIKIEGRHVRILPPTPSDSPSTSTEKPSSR